MVVYSNVILHHTMCNKRWILFCELNLSIFLWGRFVGETFEQDNPGKHHVVVPAIAKQILMAHRLDLSVLIVI